NRDIWWHDLVEEQSEQCQPEEMESEDMLFILYTSGTTGKPKGVVHTTGGYMVQTNYTARLVFDLKDTDIYWCTADVGWITGHSYIVYGLLSNGATVVMYEGSPDHPHKGRFWEIIDKHKVTILYTAPTAIRAFIKWGDDIINNYSLDSLRLLGTVGEPINPECWLWYHKVIGKERCPIVDTWWQTETGSIMISPVPGAIDTKPGSATLPLPGVDAAIVKEDGSECGVDEGGFLVIRSPWPSMLRGIYGDEERYRSQYWSRFPNLYFTGDGARKDVDGYFWIMGRVDDVINTAGHRLSTAEIESALVSHPKVAESACVGVPDEIKGEMVHAFVTLRTGECATEELTQELSDWVVEKIGAIARPKAVTITDALPKTRSGKIMRRLLKELASTGKAEGDVTTLEDKSVLDSLKPV
ncbi:MAG: acetate--CoA ligase, partial [Candidatus Dadabacteria bacterium]